MLQELSPFEIARLSGCLDRLVPHLRLDDVAVTGGVAMQLGLAAFGRPLARNGVADLDIVATSIDAVSASVVGTFLVSHFHMAGPGVPKFMIQLVDPVSRIRIDVFPDSAGSIGDAGMAPIGEHCVRVLPLERIFEHKVQTLMRASSASPVDPKHLRDALILGDILSKAVPDIAPEAVVPDVYGAEDESSCNRCTLSREPAWPLAPKDQIFQLLGWG